MPSEMAAFQSPVFLTFSHKLKMVVVPDETAFLVARPLSQKHMIMERQSALRGKVNNQRLGSTAAGGVFGTFAMSCRVRRNEATTGSLIRGSSTSGLHVIRPERQRRRRGNRATSRLFVTYPRLQYWRTDRTPCLPKPCGNRHRLTRCSSPVERSKASRSTTF